MTGTLVYTAQEAGSPFPSMHVRTHTQSQGSNSSFAHLAFLCLLNAPTWHMASCLLGGTGTVWWQLDTIKFHYKHILSAIYTHKKLHALAK